MELTSDTPKNYNIDRLFGVYRDWATLTVEQRKQRMEALVRFTLSNVNLPAVTIAWQAEGGYFDYSRWHLVMDLQAATLDPHVGTVRGADGFGWSWHATVAYHELRHSEQFFIMCQAMLTGAVAIPAGARGGAVRPTHNKADLVAIGYPIGVVDRADMLKGGFSQSAIPLVRTWVESIFGRRAGTRKQTLMHLPRNNKRWVDYTKLPEEADAWALQRYMSLKLRERISAYESEQALSGVKNLFG